MCTRLGMYIILARFHVYIFSGKSQANCYTLFAMDGAGGEERGVVWISYVELFLYTLVRWRMVDFG